ncbi:hypothetical protein V1477_019209 [Vespula maculifrons]|uniref:Uncharacterized protein n=1 Tax=Vespula maculifrons TaxID=7453 RepID=A0ABD2ARX1_VESMC
MEEEEAEEKEEKEEDEEEEFARRTEENFRDERARATSQANRQIYRSRYFSKLLREKKREEKSNKTRKLKNLHFNSRFLVQCSSNNNNDDDDDDDDEGNNKKIKNKKRRKLREQTKDPPGYRAHLSGSTDPHAYTLPHTTVTTTTTTTTTTTNERSPPPPPPLPPIILYYPTTTNTTISQGHRHHEFCQRQEEEEEEEEEQVEKNGKIKEKEKNPNKNLTERQEEGEEDDDEEAQKNKRKRSRNTKMMMRRRRRRRRTSRRTLGMHGAYVRAPFSLVWLKLWTYKLARGMISREKARFQRTLILFLNTQTFAVRAVRPRPVYPHHVHGFFSPHQTPTPPPPPPSPPPPPPPLLSPPLPSPPPPSSFSYLLPSHSRLLPPSSPTPYSSNATTLDFFPSFAVAARKTVGSKGKEGILQAQRRLDRPKRSNCSNSSKRIIFRANGECSIVSVPQFVAKLADDNPQGLELLPGFGKSQKAKPAHGLTFRIKQRYVFKLFSSDKSDNARGLTQKMGIEMDG